MKKVLLFMALGLMSLNYASAFEINKSDSHDFENHNRRIRNSQAVIFNHRGVDYAISPTGRLSFDAGIRSSDRRIRGRRVATRNNLIRYNRYGEVTKIGNTRIFYDSRGRVRKVGNIRVDYTRGWLSRVGGLDVRYNRRGKLIAARGYVNPYRNSGTNQDFGHFPDEDDAFDNGVFFERKSQ
ncbi:hypothetical protein [Nonlabens sp. SY33080]|uniref:hypothetical protein n=1 Tax=unclassified Nonlabens TaxID=2615035 RepID=UPI001428C046|nr:hypothetical protein [Nonlabens sp. SY33080]